MKLAYGIFYTKDINKILNFYQNVICLTKAFGDERFIAFAVGERLLALSTRPGILAETEGAKAPIGVEA